MRQQYGASVSGGNEFATYFISGGYENEDGVFRLSQIEEDSVRNAVGTVPDNQIRPNTLERWSLRANLGANVSRNSDLQVSIGYISSDTRFVENDNSVLTITGSAETSTNPPTVMDGWYYTPAQLFAELASQGLKRFTTGMTYNWRPNAWLTTRATVGYDIANRNDIQFFPTGRVAPQDQNNDGIRSDNRFQVSQTSVDLAATARFKLSPDGRLQDLGRWSVVSGLFDRYPGHRPWPGPRIGNDFRRGIGGSEQPDHRIPVARHLHRGRDCPEGAAVPHRRRSLRRQQRVREELQRDGVSQGQRLVADFRGAVL